MATQLPRSLRGIKEMLGSIYDEHDRQFYPSVEGMALKLIWSMRGISSAKRKGDGDKVPKLIADCFAWWVALCDFLIFEVEEVLWYKFPGICPYCGAERNCDCEGRKNQVRIPESVVQRYRDNGTRPETMADWQAMFKRIYGMANALNGYDFAIARLPEEIKEMIECILPEIEDRQKLMKELADIGARIFALTSLLEIPLQEAFLARYPGRCPNCQKSKCACNPRKGAPA